MSAQTSAAAVEAARNRVDRFLVEASKLPADRLRLFALSPADADAHGRILDEVELTAVGRGLREPLAEILLDVNARVLRRYADRGYDPTFIGLNWGRSPGTAKDRAIVAASLREAVTAIVMAPLIPQEWVNELPGGWANIAEPSRHHREPFS